MADSTLSNLPAAADPDGTELVYGVQGANNRKITLNQIKTFVLASPDITGRIQIASTTEPTIPDDGTAYLYLEDDGTGIYRLMVMLPDGNPQQIALQLGAAGSVTHTILLANGTDNLLLADGTSELLRA